MIIGLGHRAGTGKNTVGEMLYTWLKNDYPEYRVGIGSFATPLKDVANQMYNWAGLAGGNYYEQHYQEKEVVLPKIGKSPRQVWIELGNYVRSIYKETWVEMAFAVTADHDVYILTDARYPNELERLGLDGLKIKVERNSATMRSDIADCAAEGYNKWDYIIGNHGTLSDLYDSLEPVKELILQRLNTK